MTGAQLNRLHFLVIVFRPRYPSICSVPIPVTEAVIWIETCINIIIVINEPVSDLAIHGPLVPLVERLGTIITRVIKLASSAVVVEEEVVVAPVATCLG